MTRRTLAKLLAGLVALLAPLLPKRALAYGWQVRRLVTWKDCESYRVELVPRAGPVVYAHEVTISNHRLVAAEDPGALVARLVMRAAGHAKADAYDAWSPGLVKRDPERFWQLARLNDRDVLELGLSIGPQQGMSNPEVPSST